VGTPVGSVSGVARILSRGARSRNLLVLVLVLVVHAPRKASRPDPSPSPATVPALRTPPSTAGQRSGARIGPARVLGLYLISAGADMMQP
jgi:hypothetical protein